MPRDAGAQEIKSAYRKQAKRIHPDRNQSLSAAEAFHAVHLAYELLADPVRRKHYDERMATAARPQPKAASRDRSRPAAVPVVDAPVGPPAPAWAFIGLHLTGLLFGLLLIIGTIALIFTRDGHWAMLVFTAPGWFLVPDCWKGLRMKTKTPV